MILILSETKDFITDKVIEWISLDKALSFQIINEIDKIQINRIRLSCSENSNIQFLILRRNVIVNIDEVFFLVTKG